MGFDKRPHTGGRPGPPAAKRPAGAGGSAGPYNGGYAPGKGPPPPAQPMDEDEAAALAAMHNNDDVEDGPAPPEDGVDDDDEAAGGQLEDVAVHLGEAGRNWERPAPAPLDCATQDLTFQQIEVDYTTLPPDQRLRPGCDLTEAPVLRMFGVDASGASVAAFVHGFDPYFYVEAPPGFGPDDCDGLCRSLNGRLAERVGSMRGGAGAGHGKQQTRFCLSVTMEMKKSIMGYSPGGPKPFLRVALATPNLVAPARGIMESGLSLGTDGMGSRAFLTYESNVLYALRFMVDKGVVGGCWVTLPKGKYCLGPNGKVGAGVLNASGSSASASASASHHHHATATHCQIEAHVHAKDLIAHAPEGEWARLAPLRVLSFDIECAGRKGHFPEPSQDPVIQIASMVTVQGKSTPTVKNILTLDSCAPIAGAEVMSFKDEASLLRRWRDLVVEADPDVVIGYNTTNFDLPYLLERAQALKVADFPFFGRVARSRVRMRDTTFSSKAYGTRDMKEITIEGRVQLDLLTAIQREHKLSSYSLNAVSAHFLGEQKEDVHHSIISDLQNGTAETRRRLAVYCLKDAYLPQRLLDKLMLMYNHVEMARVTGVPMSYLLARGQSVKVFSQILRKARARGLVVPGKGGSRGGGGGGAGGGGGGGGPDSATYEGATVLEAKQGFYRTPVATLDFASLYPSIMMAHNLCYSTLLSRDAAARLPASQVLRSPTGDAFVKKDLAVGILPEILEELLAARKRAKKDLKEATDPFAKAVLDGRQLALKVSANSVYGFTGATVGVMPCLEISASVTAFGRDMIEHTRRLVEARYTRANGYPADAEVVYGDTDSVMVDFRVGDVAQAMDLGREAAEHVSATFAKPIKLEFEKVYNPYLLISKKRYAGLLWTVPEKWDKMDTKGIETVRRDNCALVRRVVGTCLDKLLIDRDVPGAAAYVKSTISDLLMNRLDLSLLVITKALSKAEYDVKAAHVELAKRMRARDAATAPNLGDRVAYVIVRAAKGAKAWEKAEDPVWALDHALPIDAQHYLDHHLAQPLLRIFEPLMRNPRELLQGEHTRSIALSTPTAAAGGIMRFAKVKKTCLGCKAPLPEVAVAAASKKENCGGGDSGDGSDGGSALCKHCAPRRAEIYSRALGAATALEDAFASLWTQCQRCQGSLHADVLCTSRDCPIFYRRKKVAKDLAEAGATLARFPDAEAW